MVGGWEVFPLIDFLCLRSDALGSAIKQIIIWDFGTLLLLLFFFFHCISLVFHLFPGSEKKIFSVLPRARGLLGDGCPCDGDLRRKALAGGP